MKMIMKEDFYCLEVFLIINMQVKHINLSKILRIFHKVTVKKLNKIRFCDLMTDSSFNNNSK